jgi:hypothetical protein
MGSQAGSDSTLEARIRLIEDRLEIYNLITSHPPRADTSASDYTASVWTEDGVFDRGTEFPAPTGRAAIAGTGSSPEHHRAIEGPQGRTAVTIQPAALAPATSCRSWSVGTRASPKWSRRVVPW